MMGKTSEERVPDGAVKLDLSGSSGSFACARTGDAPMLLAELFFLLFASFIWMVREFEIDNGLP